MRSTDPRSRNRPSTSDRVLQAARIPPLVVQAEAELEVLGSARLRSSASLLHPDAEVAPQVVDLVAPDALDGGRQRSRRTRQRRDRGRVQRPDGLRERRLRDGERVPRLERAEELGLHLVKQAAARERIHAHERLGLVPGLEPVDRGEQELVRAASRTAAAPTANTGRRAEAVRVERGRDAGATPTRPSLGDQAGRAARPAADDRSPQRLVQAEQVVRVPFHRRADRANRAAA